MRTFCFRYAEHVAEGRGIVFNSGGPPTEGSTDFLWLMLLSASVAIGLDVAIAALALNAMGASAVAFAIAVSMKKLVDSPEWLKLPFSGSSGRHRPVEWGTGVLSRLRHDAVLSPGGGAVLGRS